MLKATILKTLCLETCTKTPNNFGKLLNQNLLITEVSLHCLPTTGIQLMTAKKKHKFWIATSNQSIHKRTLTISLICLEIPIRKCLPSHITPEGVKKLLSDLKPNKASGPDQLPATFLKECAKELAPILLAIFNQSLNSGDLPSDWLMSHITPIFKKGNKNSPGNYRPIALTSICCKIFEHILTSNIMSHLESTWYSCGLSTRLS